MGNRCPSFYSCHRAFKPCPGSNLRFFCEAFLVKLRYLEMEQRAAERQQKVRVVADWCDMVMLFPYFSIGQDIGVPQMILKVWYGRWPRMWVSASQFLTPKHILSEFVEVNPKLVMTPGAQEVPESLEYVGIPLPTSLHHPPFWLRTRLKLRRRIEILNWRSSELKGPRPVLPEICLSKEGPTSDWLKMGKYLAPTWVIRIWNGVQFQRNGVNTLNDVENVEW